MSALEDIRRARLDKLERLKRAGMNPFPLRSARNFTVREVNDNFDEREGIGRKLTLAGRVRSLRPQGGLTFLDFDDGTGFLQALLRKGAMSDDRLELFNDTVDIGDFVDFSGTLMRTKAGELTILVEEWRMLAKSLRPLPDKWHGLQDVEERYRHRYLDLIFRDEVRRRFTLRSATINALRTFFLKEGYIEVETPILQPLAGGATAKPFVTHELALDIDLYLRVAQELYLKELLVGGLSKVFEIGRVFRNEGIDVNHHPEFTMLESQEAYADATAERKLIERLMRFVVKKVLGGLSFRYGGSEVNVGGKFAVISFYDLLRRYALISHPEKADLEELRPKANQLGVSVAATDSPFRIMDNIYRKTCRPKLTRPTFIVDYPISSNPFAKRREDTPTLTDRFQLVVGGLEIVNGFSELNDPLEQRERYKDEETRRSAGDEDISPNDERYVEAMEYGMPPNGGIGIGVDRLVMLLTDTSNIREVILFPTLRPKK